MKKTDNKKTMDIAHERHRLKQAIAEKEKELRKLKAELRLCEAEQKKKEGTA